MYTTLNLHIAEYLLAYVVVKYPGLDGEILPELIPEE